MLLIATHALLADHFVPFRSVFSEHPLQGVDYDLHIGQVFRVVDALRDWGHSWAYDVQLLAGQPEGTITDSGSKGWELWTFALHGLGVPRAMAFNSFVLVVMLTAPFWLFLAARTFQMSRWTSVTVAAMASSLWFFDSHLHWVWFIGMISWSGASCLAIFTLARFHRFVAEPSARAAAICAAGVALGHLIHPYTFFVLAPPMAFLYARAFRRFTRREHAMVCAIVAITLAANAFWLHNAAQHWHYILDSAFFAQAEPKYVLCDFFEVLCNGADTGLIGTRTGFRFLYLGLAIAGLATWRTARDPRFLPIVACLLPLYAVAYFGGFIPGMQQTQPYRQVTPAMLLTTLPAAAFVTDVLIPRVLRPRAPASTWALGALGFALLQHLLATQVLYFFPSLLPHPKDLPDGLPSPISAYGHTSRPDLPVHVRYVVPHDPEVLEPDWEPVIRYLELKAAPGDRVLVQLGVLGERLAWRTNLEVLGGFLERNVEHIDANYFRKHLHAPATPEAIAHYVRVYGVQWVVTSQPEFDSIPDVLRRVTALGPHRVYRTQVPMSRILEGGGAVSARQNVIRVKGSDPNRPLVLSYHWHEALRCSPSCRVERQSIDIDRVGFIRIPAPHPPDVTIWNSYQMR